jgi:hypothetical protein
VDHSQKQGKDRNMKAARYNLETYKHDIDKQ